MHLGARRQTRETISTSQRLLQTQMPPQRAAAENITLTYEACMKQSKGVARMWDLWNIFCNDFNSLGDPTSNLEQLVWMRTSVSKLLDIVDNRNKVTKSSMNSQVFRRKLPGCEFYFREVAMSEATEENGQGLSILPSLPPSSLFPFPLLAFSMYQLYFTRI